jgi:hypothetical protein
MVTQKRLKWLIVSLLVITAGIMFLATRLSYGETNSQQSPKTRIKVLRRNDRVALKPTRQEIQDDQPPQQERVLINQIPQDLPITVKLKKEKEKAFKDSKSDKWARDLELEVKNIGNRPIYYLVLLINLPELRIGASNLIFDLRFGDNKFINFASGATSDDLALKPGKTTTLRIQDGDDLDWNDFSRGRYWPRPIRFELEFQELSFGDGTGFRSGGRPWPAPRDGNSGYASLKNANKDPTKGSVARMCPDNEKRISSGGKAVS